MFRVIFLLVLLSLNACSFLYESLEEETVFEPSKQNVKSADELSPEEEDFIGRAVSLRVLTAYPAIESENFNSYLNSIGQTVAAVAPRSDTFAGYRFVVLDSAEVNAMAAPGGYIFVSKGFLKRLSDEDELAAVLAHEVAHISQKHGLKQIKPSNLADFVEVGGVLATAVDCSGVSQQLLTAFSGAVEDVFNTLVTAGYSRQQEFEADKLAKEILLAAGYEPSALDRALNKLETVNGTETTKGAGGWFDTHPSVADRLEALPKFDTLSGGNITKAGYSLRKKRFVKNYQLIAK